MRKESFNKEWKYWPEGNAFALFWNVDENAQTVTLPHDAMLFSPTKADSINGGNTGFRDGNVYHYSKEFCPDSSMKDKTLILHFEGVYCNSQVYINSEYAGGKNYGYSGFYIKLNNYLKWDQPNEIRVIVRNFAMPNSRWYSGGGIYRDVNLLIGGAAYIRPDASNVITESIDDGIGVINIKSSIVNRLPNRSNFEVKHTVFDADGNQVGQSVCPATLFEGREQEFSARIAIKDANLWSDASPYLYTLKTELLDGEQTVDVEELTFGIRTLQLDAIRGLRVNGKSVKLSGACIHHDNGLLGAATYYDFHYRQIQILKSMGYNAIRMAHNPAAPVLLRACDELGMYVMDEAFDMWTRCKTSNDYAIVFDQNWEEDVEAFVRKDFLHPSVILYSIGNEIPEIGTERGAYIAKQISEKIRGLDQTRYTLSSINGMFAIGHKLKEIMGDVLANHPDENTSIDKDANVNEVMSVFKYMDEILMHDITSKLLAEAGVATDVLGYNYMTSRYEHDMECYPNRIIVGSETYPASLPRNWTIVKKNPALIGDFVWTGWDYIGESGIGITSYERSGDGFGTPYPCILSYAGEIDITGYARPAAYLASIVFGKRKVPYICTQNPMHFNDTVYKTPWALTDCLETWTYPGCQGKDVRVEVYSAGDEVALILNGKEVGRKPAGESVGFITKFEITYQPGELTAVTYESGSEVARWSIFSHKDTDLHFTTESGASGKLAFVAIENVDGDGVLNYEDEIEIEVKAAKNAKVFAGSGNPTTKDLYFDGKTKTYHGRALAVVVKDDAEQMAEITINGTSLKC